MNLATPSEFPLHLLSGYCSLCKWMNGTEETHKPGVGTLQFCTAHCLTPHGKWGTMSSYAHLCPSLDLSGHLGQWDHLFIPCTQEPYRPRGSCTKHFRFSAYPWPWWPHTFSITLYGLFGPGLLGETLDLGDTSEPARWTPSCPSDISSSLASLICLSQTCLICCLLQGSQWPPRGRETTLLKETGEENGQS